MNTQSDRFRQWQAIRPEFAQLLGWLRMPQEQFDFLGYTFGRLWSPRTGHPYLGVSPSKKRIHRLGARVGELTDRRSTSRPLSDVVADLNRLAVGWANYFCLGSVSKAYRIVDEPIRHRLRMWRNHKHKVRAGVHHIDAAESRALGLGPVKK